MIWFVEALCMYACWEVQLDYRKHQIVNTFYVVSGSVGNQDRNV